MIKHSLIKKFVNRLSNKVSRKRVIMKASKTLTEAAQFAPYANSAVCVEQNYSTAAFTYSTVSSLGLRGRASSSGPTGFASSDREQSTTRYGGLRGRGRYRSVKRIAFNSESRASRSNPKFGQSQQKDLKAIKWFNCLKLDHYAHDYRSGRGFGQSRNTSGNGTTKSRHYSNYKHRVLTVGRVSDQKIIEE